MSIKDALRSFIYGPDLDRRAAPAFAGGLVAGGTRAAAVWPSYDLDGQIARGYRLAVLHACIDAIARDVSAAPLRVYQEIDGQPHEQPQHLARALLANPNPAMSEAEFWYFVTAQAALTGFCVIEKARSAAGLPVQLWPLVSPWLKVRPVAQAAPDWEYRVPGNPAWPLAAADVIVVTYRPDPYGAPTGRTPVTSLKRELAIDDQMTDLLNVLLERGGVPPVGLRVLPQDGKIPKLDQAEADRIVERWRQKYGGVHNWDKPAYLGGLSVERIGLDLGEMLFPDVRDWIELHICTALGVPAGMIGTKAGLERNTFTNYKESVQQYYDGTISPLWARLDGALTRGLLPEFDPAGIISFEFDTSGIRALQEDEGPKWDRAIQAVGAGILTVDDARAQVGLPPLPNGAGEVLLLPFSVTPTRPEDLPLAGSLPAAANPPALPSGDSGDDTGDGDNADTTLADRPLAFRADGRLMLQSRAALHQRSKQTIARLAGVGAPKLRAFWRAQGKRIVEVVTARSFDGVDSDGRMIFTGTGRLFRVAGYDAFAASFDKVARPLEARDLTEIDWDDEERRLAEVLRQFYVLNGETAFAAASAQLSAEIAFDLANPNVRRVLDRLASRIRGIHETTMNDVRQVVADALDEGVTMSELSDRLTGLFEQTYKSRAMTSARTESQVAYNSASTLAYQESGKVASAELLDNPNHGDYAGDADGYTCATRNGLIVPLEETQVHIEGTHINCILAVAPVLAVPLGED